MGGCWNRMLSAKAIDKIGQTGAGMIRQTQGSMSEAQAGALGMLSPCAGVAAMAGVLAELAFASSPRAAGKPWRSLFYSPPTSNQSCNPHLYRLSVLLLFKLMLSDTTSSSVNSNLGQVT